MLLLILKFVKDCRVVGCLCIILRNVFFYIITLYTIYIIFLISHWIYYNLRSVIYFSFRLIVGPSCWSFVLIATVCMGCVKTGKLSSHWEDFLFWCCSLIIKCSFWVLSMSIKPFIHGFSIFNADIIFNSWSYCELCLELRVILI